MKFWCISDSHNKHAFLNIPNGIDGIIHAGDMSNQRNPSMNANEVLNFLEWYKSLVHIKYKILIAGNHDTSIEAGLVKRSDIHESITYLEHESCEIEGIKIFGSPYTPSFGQGWSFNIPRHKLDSYWQEIPLGTDIIITHGPPKGILDLTAEGSLFFQCGCKTLLNRLKIIEPKYSIFGHIHTESNCTNAGKLEIQGCKTTFINASVVNLDYEICNNGYIIEI